MASIKHLKWLIIPVFAILLMSHNTFADSQLLDNYYLVRQTSGNPYCRQINGEWLNLTWFEVGTAYRVKEMQCVDSDSPNSRISAISGDIVVIELATDGLLQPMWYNTSARYLASTYDETPTHDIETIYFLTDGFNNSVEFSVYNESDRVIHYRPISINIYRRQGGAPNYNQALQEIKDAINNKSVPSASDIGNAVNDSQEQATQDAADNASDAGSSSAASAQGATSSLISVIGGFVGVLTSASPSNCLLNANMNHIDMGQIDLCANPVPSYIQIIGSIILICAAIPLAIVLFNRFIGLFRSFQG